MRSISKLLSLCIIALLSFSAYSQYSYHDPNEPKCAHNLYNNNVDPQLLDVQEEFLSNQTRFLTTSSYPNLRITSDYSLFTQGTQDFITYVKTQLLPPVISYYEAALGVKQPLSSPLKLSPSYTKICDYTTPKILFSGVPTDFYLIVTSTSDSTQNWVASGGSCYLSSTTKRPVIARMMFNMYYTKATTDVLVHEKNMYLTMHEMTHALGFTGSSFLNFIDANGKTLTGHIKSVLLDGVTRTVLDVEPLTSKLRTHFGCSTLPGAFMEDDGGAGTEGSHFERRHFMYETMTSGVIHGRRVSEFSLSVLEGSGWYMPNYTYAEPFYFGKGEGCNFLYQTCAAANTNFDEFCSGGGRGCTAVGRGGGVCATDSRSDGCAYYVPTLDYDCEEPSSVDNARLPTVEVFGRSAGSRCFSGTLSKTSTKASSTSMCFKFTCNGSGSTTTLDVTLGTTKATCKKKGALKVTGYNGELECPDPLTFCTTVGKKYCPRNCMGRGKCVNYQCVCNSGFTGIDCGIYGQLTAIDS